MRVNTELSPVLAGKTDPMMINDIDLERFYSEERVQNIIFRAGASVYDEMRAVTSWQDGGNKMHLIGQIVKLTDEYIRSRKIKVMPEVFGRDILARYYCA